MSTLTLPAHIGGYQHLAPDIIAREDDIYVLDGIPDHFVELNAGQSVGHLEDAIQMRVYRLLPVAKQSDAHEREFGEARAAGQHWAQKQLEASAMSPSKPPLPSDAAKRKATPIYSGFLKYFPRACAEVARVSQAGNDQHNPGSPLHWDRSKSGDELDALSRHLLEAGTLDSDGQRHSAKLAWRAMANLEKELEAEQ